MENFNHIFEMNPTKDDITKMIENNMGEFVRRFFRTTIEGSLDNYNRRIFRIEQKVEIYLKDLNRITVFIEDKVAELKKYYRNISKHEQLLVKKITQLKQQIEAMKQ